MYAMMQVQCKSENSVQNLQYQVGAVTCFELFQPGFRSSSSTLAAMTSPSSPKYDFFKNIINPYLAEVKMHPQVLQLKDGVIHKKNLEGPKKEGDAKVRLEEMEQEVFKYKKMVECGVCANHSIIAELITIHKEDTEELRRRFRIRGTRVLMCKHRFTICIIRIVSMNLDSSVRARLQVSGPRRPDRLLLTGSGSRGNLVTNTNAKDHHGNKLEYLGQWHSLGLFQAWGSAPVSLSLLSTFVM